MLSDVEFFIITWVLAVVSFVSLYFQAYTTSQLLIHKTKDQNVDEVRSKLRWSEKRTASVRFISILMFFTSSVLGIMINFANYIPFSERNYETDTAILRVLRAPSGLFIAPLVIVTIWTYIMEKTLRQYPDCEEIKELEKSV